MKKRDNYRIEILRLAKCGERERKALIELHGNFFAEKPSRQLSVADIKMACRRNHVFVIREQGTGEPIIGVLVLVIVYLFDGPVAVIERPSMIVGYERLFEPLILKAIKFASDIGVESIEIPHRTLGVKWKLKEVLLDLGFSPIGSRIHSLKIRD